MPVSERRATIAVAALVPLVSASLWLFGFRRTAQWVERSARKSPGTAAPVPVVVEEGVIALSRVRRYTPWTGRCLARSLSLWWILRRRSVAASLHLGVRVVDGKVDAHAWVVHEGRVLADSDAVWADFPAAFASTADLTFGKDLRY